MSELRLSPEQQVVLETWGKGLAIMAGAGSGKTTTLVQKCAELLRRNSQAKFAAVSFTGIGGRSGAASSSRSLIASAALPIVLSFFGARSARIFSTMFSRYSGSFAASDTAWVPARANTPSRQPKASRTTIRVDGMRPSLHCSKRRTAGASRNAKRIAIASGISTSLAR